MTVQAPRPRADVECSSSVINFSGGDKVRIETARFRDVSVGPPAK